MTTQNIYAVKKRICKDTIVSRNTLPQTQDGVVWKARTLVDEQDVTW